MWDQQILLAGEIYSFVSNECKQGLELKQTLQHREYKFSSKQIKLKTKTNTKKNNIIFNKYFEDFYLLIIKQQSLFKQISGSCPLVFEVEKKWIRVLLAEACRPIWSPGLFELN